MKVILIGLPFFCRKLADRLSIHADRNIFVFLNVYGQLIDKIKFIFHLINADVVYSIGGTANRSLAVNCALLLNKKVVMHWVGTDVIQATQEYNLGVFNCTYQKRVTHFCEVSWIQTELEHIGITADIVPFATLNDGQLVESEMPEKFVVLSYVSKDRETFYGIQKLIDLAKCLPDIEVVIVGISDYHEPTPPNLRFLGWVDNMDEQYADCVLYLRLPEHDGLAFSVLEALSKGRYVGYTQDFCNTTYIDCFKTLQEFTTCLYDKFIRCKLELNHSGMSFISENYNEELVLNNLISKFEHICNSR